MNNFKVGQIYELAEGNYGYLSGKFSGYISSIPAAYHRETEKAKQQAEFKQSEHVGQVKEKLEFEAELFNVFGFDGNFGYVEYYLFKDASGNVTSGKLHLCQQIQTNSFWKKVTLTH